VEEDKAGEDLLQGTMEDVEEERDFFCFSFSVVMSSESSNIRFLKTGSCVGIVEVMSGNSKGSELVLKGSSSSLQKKLVSIMIIIPQGEKNQYSRQLIN
jgi:hypothetical protein